MRKALILVLILFSFSACNKKSNINPNSGITCIHDTSTVTLTPDSSRKISRILISERTPNVSKEEFELSKEIMQMLFDEMAATKGVNTNYSHNNNETTINIELDFSVGDANELGAFGSPSGGQNGLNIESFVDYYESIDYVCN